MENEKKTISSFKDLEIYQTTYDAMLLVCTNILPKLSKPEQNDLKEQLSGSVKTIPRLIAKGYYIKRKKDEFQKCIDDALVASAETIVSLSQALDLYPTYVDAKLCNGLINTYVKASKQLGYAPFYPVGKSEEIKHAFPVGTTLEEMEKELIIKTLSHVGGNRTTAARILEIAERTLYRKLDKYGLR